MKTRNLTWHLFACICAASLSLSSCRENGKDQPTPAVKIPLEVYNYCYFKVGSWWVYQDSATGNLDTVFVTESQKGTDSSYYQKNSTQPIYEWFTMNTRSTDNGYNYKYTLHTSWEHSVVFRIKTKPGHAAGQTICFFWQLFDGKKLHPYTQNGEVTFIHSVDSLSLLSATYHDILVFKDSENITEENAETLFYYSKGTGIVKKEMPGKNQTWQLISCHIQQ